MKKIFILGPSRSGKTTLERALDKISKIITNNQEITNFDLVVCNADPPMVYSKLLNKHNLKRPFKKEKNLLYSMGLFVLFLGSPTFAGINNITLFVGSTFAILGR